MPNKTCRKQTPIILTQVYTYMQLVMMMRNKDERYKFYEFL